MSEQPQVFEPHVPATVTLPIGEWERVIQAVAKQYTYDEVKNLVPALVDQVRASAAARVAAASQEAKPE